MKFKNKVALVTGASDGIGRALALELARAGADVAILARSTARLQELSKQVEAFGVRSLPLTCDVTDRAALTSAVHQTAESFGRLDLLINNAGMGLYSEMTQVPLDDFERLMELNFWAPIVATQAAATHLEKRGGIIINISSILGKLDYPGMGAYCATKHAVNSISNVLRMELREKGIEVLTVCPGRVDTGFQLHAIKYQTLRNPRFSVAAMSPEWVARVIVRAAWRHKREIVLPRAGWVLVAIQHLWPRLGDRLAMTFMTR